MQRASGEDRLYRVPYGDGELEFMVQPWFDVDVVTSEHVAPIADVPAAVRQALAEPLASRGRMRRLLRNVWHLGDMASDVANIAGRGARAVVVVTDLTRACPDSILVPPILDVLNAGGIPDERITVIVAVGLHRPTTEAGKREKLGGVVERLRPGADALGHLAGQPCAPGIDFKCLQMAARAAQAHGDPDGRIAI